MSRPNEGAEHLDQMGRGALTTHQFWRDFGRIFLEVVDVGVGVGYEVGMLCVVEAILAIATGGIEALVFRRAAGASGIGLFERSEFPIPATGTVYFQHVFRRVPRAYGFCPNALPRRC